MPTFKLTLKLILKNLPVFALNMIVLIGISILVGSFYNGGSEDLVKTKVALVNQGNQSAVIEAFSGTLDDIAEIKFISSDKTSMQDALFYKTVDYILIFPEGFGERFFTEDKIAPQKMTLPDSFAGVQIDNRLALFTNTATVYYNAGNSESAALESAVKDINIKAELKIEETFKTKELFRFKTFCAFSLMTLFSFMGNLVIIPMLIIKKEKLMQRSLCAPQSSKKINLELLLAVGILYVLACIIYLGIGAAIFGSVAFSSQGLWMCLSSIVVGFTLLGLSFMISTFVKSLAAVNFVATSLSLIFCFAGGAFVPIEFLSQGFQTFGKMTPAWWFVDNIERAYNSFSITGTFIRQTLGNIAILMAFGIAAILVGLAVQKHKSVKRS